MSPVLRVLEAGPNLTIQDSGRIGWRRFGVSAAGAMDLESYRLGNLLVGNDPNEAALEFAFAGGTWEVAADSCRVAVTGGDFAVRIDDAQALPWRGYVLSRGQRVRIEGARDAVWGYVAVAGGFALGARLGSHATHTRSGLGHFAGRCLAAGDEVPLRLARAPDGPDRRATAPPARPPAPIRVVLGPQDDYFAAETIALFLGTAWTVSHRGDRMGIWLEGPKLGHSRGHDVVSDGVLPGCIQVPGSGQPIVLARDCQTMGGYPKLATIVSADLSRFFQTGPGRPVRFRAVDIETAQRGYRDHRARQDSVASEMEPLPGGAR